jgi:hypothetical protein
MKSSDIAKMIEICIEARRYVASQSSRAAQMVNAISEQLTKLNQDWHVSTVDLVHRLRENLEVGVQYSQVDPDVLAAYLYTTAFELRVYQGRLEQEEGENIS